MKPYQSIPVDEARAIARRYEKAIVIINAWDDQHQKLHTVTYGVSPNQKIQAGKAGEITATALGMDLTKKETTEDFRTVCAARNAQLRDMTEGIISAFRSYQFGNSSPDLAKEFADKLESLIKPNSVPVKEGVA